MYQYHMFLEQNMSPRIIKSKWNELGATKCRKGRQFICNGVINATHCTPTQFARMQKIVYIRAYAPIPKRLRKRTCDLRRLQVNERDAIARPYTNVLCVLCVLKYPCFPSAIVRSSRSEMKRSSRSEMKRSDTFCAT